MRKTINYRKDCGMPQTEYLSEALFDELEEQWLDELHEIIFKLIAGSINLDELQRMRTLCSRLDVTLDSALLAIHDLTDEQTAVTE